MPIRNLSIKKSLSKDKIATNIKGGKKKSQKQFSKRVNKRNRSKRNKRKRGGGNSITFEEIGGCIDSQTMFKYNELGKSRAEANKDRDPDSQFVIVEDMGRDGREHMVRVQVRVSDNPGEVDKKKITFLSYIETVL